MRLAFLPALLALLLGGCGAKGPLYLPSPGVKPPEAQTKPAEVAPAPSTPAQATPAQGTPKQPQQEKTQ